MNPVIEQMLAHRSIRKFTDEPVHEAGMGSHGTLPSTAAIEPDLKMKGTDHEN